MEDKNIIKGTDKGVDTMIPHEVITIQRHILEQQRKYPGATGEFSGLLADICLAAKMIARDVRKAGLVNILGLTGSENVHGERVTKLDEYANRVLYEILGRSGHLCVMASEESENTIPIPDGGKRGKYDREQSSREPRTGRHRNLQ